MVIFKKEYSGFEDSYDVDRDVSEAMDADFNPIWKTIGGEWLGTLKIIIEYVDENICFLYKKITFKNEY